jgi:hypothetical protein
MYKFVTLCLLSVIAAANEEGDDHMHGHHDDHEDHAAGADNYDPQNETGLGTADEPRVYVLVSPELGQEKPHDDESNTEYPKLWAEFYYKTNVDTKVPELHGNAFFETTWELEADAEISFGWLIELADETGEAHGLRVDFVNTQPYLAADENDADAVAYQGAYTVTDITAGNVDGEIEDDTEQHYTFVAKKSKKDCTEAPRCIWKVHFFRNMETDDDQDVQWTFGVLDNVNLQGFYSISSPEVSYRGVTLSGEMGGYHNGLMDGSMVPD